MNIVTSRRPRWLIFGGGTLLVALVGAGVWAGSGGGNPTLASTTTTSTLVSAPRDVPKAPVAADAAFLTDVTEVDPALTTYEKGSGNVALRSLLTDGTAFCSFLSRDRDIDTAMVSVVIGARHVESRTRLPLSVTTFNAVDSVALLTLCPSLQPLVPPSDLAKIRQLGAALAVPVN
jgi:hypothetical protein